MARWKRSRTGLPIDMPRTIDREQVLRVLSGHDPVAAGRQARATLATVKVTYSRTSAPADWLVDGETEQPLEAHAEAHRAGIRSEAALRYGAGRTPDEVADRLLGLAELADASDLLMAVCPVPGEGDSRRPGSWGVEDLSVVAAARICLPTVSWIRPSWRLLGPAACQVAVAFGANDWHIPPDDQSDPAHLAAAVGVEAVER